MLREQNAGMVREGGSGAERFKPLPGMSRECVSGLTNEQDDMERAGADLARQADPWVHVLKASAAAVWPVDVPGWGAVSRQAAARKSKELLSHCLD